MIKLYLCIVLCIERINNNNDMIARINELLQEVEALKAANAEEAGSTANQIPQQERSH